MVLCDSHLNSYCWFFKYQVFLWRLHKQANKTCSGLNNNHFMYFIILCIGSRDPLCGPAQLYTEMSVVHWRISWRLDNLGRMALLTGMAIHRLLAGAYQTDCRLPCGLSSSSRLARVQLCGSRVLGAARESKSQCTSTFQVSLSGNLLVSVGQS